MPSENAHAEQLNRNEDCRRNLFQVERADWTPDEVGAAIAFLKSRGHLAQIVNEDGATQYFEITADGTLCVERGSR